MLIHYNSLLIEKILTLKLIFVFWLVLNDFHFKNMKKLGILNSPSASRVLAGDFLQA